MKKLLRLLLLTPLFANAQYNLTQVGYLDYNLDSVTNLKAAGIWGYVDSLGNEYALVGTEYGSSIVDVTNPAAPVEKLFVPGIFSQWREAKSYGHYAYFSTEAHEGVTIVDMQNLPGALSMADVTHFTGTAGEAYTAHTLFITENGVLVLNGSYSSVATSGVLLYDLTANPVNPPLLGNSPLWYTHDSYARGDTLYCANIDDGFFSILDISNPSAGIPVLSTGNTTPKTFTHNCWLSGNGDYLFTTDEVPASWIAAYDITDFGNITEVDRIRHSETDGAVPHNTVWINDYLVTAYYTNGVTIHDVSDPHNMVEVGHFDTSPISGSSFSGCWGVYPYLPSGRILATDREEGLFILEPTYTRAGYLEGHITDAVFGTNIFNAQVELLGTPVKAHSDLLGHYSMSHASPGSYQVIFSHPNYYPDTVTVNLVSGGTVIQDMQLQPLQYTQLYGNVTNVYTGQPIDSAQVLVENDVYSYHAYTDAGGNYVLPQVFMDSLNPSFSVTVGSWGYTTYCDSISLYSLPTALDVQLVPGYYDDFTFDFGWTVQSTCTQGMWERGKPVGTNSISLPFAPFSDATGDCSNKAYVTGNAVVTSSAAQDLDFGYTHLYSPTFNVTGYSNPRIHFKLWARISYNTDSINIYLNDGINRYVLATYTHTGTGTVVRRWDTSAYQVSDYTPQTHNLRLEVKASSHTTISTIILEAGLDHFYITGGEFSGIAEETKAENSLNVYPNPAAHELTMESENTIVHIEITDISGKRVLQQNVNAQRAVINIHALEKGIYNLCATDKNGNRKVARVVKQ